MVEKGLAEAAEQALEELFQRLPMNYRPRIEWRAYRVTAGMAYYRTGVIGLSRSVLKDAEAVRETVGHEYAHLLAVDRHGPSAAGHGLAWQQAMRDVGLPPTVRHSFAVERNKRRQRVVYRCLRCRVEVVVARRLPRRRHYIHRDCGGDLRLVRVEAVIHADLHP